VLALGGAAPGADPTRPARAVGQRGGDSSRCSQPSSASSRIVSMATRRLRLAGGGSPWRTPWFVRRPAPRLPPQVRTRDAPATAAVAGRCSKRRRRAGGEPGGQPRAGGIGVGVVGLDDQPVPGKTSRRRATSTCPAVRPPASWSRRRAEEDCLGQAALTRQLGERLQCRARPMRVAGSSGSPRASPALPRRPGTGTSEDRCGPAPRRRGMVGERGSVDVELDDRLDRIGEDSPRARSRPRRLVGAARPSDGPEAKVSPASAAACRRGVQPGALPPPERVRRHGVESSSRPRRGSPSRGTRTRTTSTPPAPARSRQRRGGREDGRSTPNHGAGGSPGPRAARSERCDWRRSPRCRLATRRPSPLPPFDARAALGLRPGPGCRDVERQLWGRGHSRRRRRAGRAPPSRLETQAARRSTTSRASGRPEAPRRRRRAQHGARRTRVVRPAPA
jgi:hypothetical protein